MHLLSFFSIGTMSTTDATQVFRCFLSEEKIEALVRPAGAATPELWIITNDLIPEATQSTDFGRPIQFVKTSEELEETNDEVMLFERFSISGKKAWIACSYKGHDIRMKLVKREEGWKVMHNEVSKVEADKGTKTTYKKNKF